MSIWIGLWLFHIAFIIGNLGAFFLVPFIEPWYISFPICMTVGRAMFSKECPLTDLENSLRRKLGWPKIHGFVGHYFIKPFRSVKYRVEHAKERSISNESSRPCGEFGIDQDGASVDGWISQAGIHS